MSYSIFDLQRFQIEASKDKTRSEFERDRARILYSQALRRLGDKTQVLGAGSDDYVRTRLTHSLEVAQVGRQLALWLKADPSLVEAACLAHDIGHPPFGHNGEAVLNRAAKDIGGFEGNAQTFRLLTYLEPKEFTDNKAPIGLNLTRSTLDACIKYPWDRSTALARLGAPDNWEETVKFNVYSDNLSVFNWVRKDAPPLEKCVEAQIMDISDDISYCVHDFEDAVALGKFNPVDLKESFHQEKIIAVLNSSNCISDAGVKENASAKENAGMRVEDIENAFKFFIDSSYFDLDFSGTLSDFASLKNLTSSLIGHFVKAVANNASSSLEELIRYNGELDPPADIHAQIQVLKAISVLFVMDSRDMAGVKESQEKIITILLDKLMQFSPAPSPLLEPIFRQMWEECSNDGQRLRVAIDQIASLTDTRAKQLANSIF
jgi:dGTPase